MKPTDNFSFPPTTDSPEETPTEAPEEMIKSLLRTAGRRPPVPEVDAETVRAAVRAQWEWTVKKNRRRSLLRRTGAFLAVAAALFVVLGPTAQRWMTTLSPAGTVEWISHDLRAGAGFPAGTQLTVGAALPTGSTIETTVSGNEHSRAVIQLASGPTIRLDSNTLLRFESATTLELLSGGIFLDSGTGPDGPGLEVRTPHGMVRDIGTRFEVRLAATREAMRIRVRDGEVLLEQGKTTHNALAGEEISVEADGKITTRSIPIYGPAWEWTQKALPLFDSQGRTLGEFLDWATREGGWTLDLAADIPPETTRHTLHGSISELTLDEALTLILLAEDLNHRVEEGRLIVRRNTSPE